MTDQSIIIGKDPAVHNPQPFFLHPDDRTNHVLLLGLRTQQHSNVLWNMMVKDIENGAGLAVIDTTGRYADPLLDAIPNWRSHRTYFWRPSDSGRVVGFNPFRGVPEAQRSRASQHIMALFKAIWDLDYDRTPLLLDILRSSARLLLDSDDGTLLGMYALLTNDDYRRRLVGPCTDPIVKRFWIEFDGWSKADKRDKPQPVLTRLRAFLSDPTLRNVLGQVDAALDLERVVRERQILIADLDRTVLGPETARLFACLLVTRFQSILESRRGGWPFYLYIPAVEQVHTAIVGNLTEGRYAAAGVVAALQQIGHLTIERRAALLAAERIVTFRTPAEDAAYLAPRFTLPQAEQSLLSLTENSLAISDYRRELMAPERLPARWRQRAVITKRSRRALGAPHKAVERKIHRFLQRY